MQKPYIYRILLIIITIILTVTPDSIAVTKSSFISVLDNTGKEVLSISVTGNNKGTTLNVLSGKTMTVNNNMVLNSPPRIIFDVLYKGPQFTTVNTDLKNSNLKRIRVGYHPGNTRIVLDVRGTDIPGFSHHVNNHKLTIFVTTKNNSNDNKLKTAKNDREKNKIAPEISSDKENIHKNSSKDADSNNITEPIAAVVQKPKPVGNIPEKKQQIDPSALLVKELIEFEPKEENEEAALYIAGVNAFKEKDFQKASDSFDNLIKINPRGNYSEKAYFLLAKALEQLYIKAASQHFAKIKKSYDNAVYRYPSSRFTSDALLSVGNLCLKNDYFSEAIAYYNRIIEKNVNPFITVKALLQKGFALCEKKKYSEAISIYENIISSNNDFGKTQAELGIAKALFEMNSFQKSIYRLVLLEQEPENISRFPDIALYLGYNYYQMGNYTNAINNLFKYYNIYPDSPENHIVLSKIGDAYKAKKMTEAASKIYRLVFDRFPEKEGALISLTRLAELQENGKLDKGNNLVSFKITEKKLSSPQNIYEKVIDEYLNKDSKNPMVEYAMLKLALLYNKQNNYSKSVEILDDLLNKYPQSKLRPEIIYALTDNFEAIVRAGEKNEDKKEACIDVVNIYLNKKNIIHRFAPPRTLLAVALACRLLGLEDMAAELLTKAYIVFPDKEKPEELLYYLGKHLIEHGQQENGLKKLDMLIENYQTGEFIAKVYHIKGNLFSNGKNNEKALEMFSKAMESNPKIEEKILILADKAMALDKSGLKNKSIETAEAAANILANYPKQNQFIYHKVGEVCLHLGKPEDALFLLNNKMAEGETGKIDIKSKFLIAQCYEALNKKSDYITLYNQLSKSDDPLWSKLAKEKMEAIIFNELLTKTEFNKSGR